MTQTWLAIGALVVVTATIRGAGPLLVGDRDLPGYATAVIGLLAPALLAALIVTGSFTDDGELAVDARVAGLLCAGVAVIFRAPILVTVVIAATATALVRAIA